MTFDVVVEARVQHTSFKTNSAPPLTRTRLSPRIQQPEQYVYIIDDLAPEIALYKMFSYVYENEKNKNLMMNKL